jgi:hypothetical protein
METTKAKVEIFGLEAHERDLWFLGEDARYIYTWTQAGYRFIEDSSGDLIGNFYKEKKGLS